jgi:hypothetical protein
LPLARLIGTAESNQRRSATGEVNGAAETAELTPLLTRRCRCNQRWTIGGLWCRREHSQASPLATRFRAAGNTEPGHSDCFSAPTVALEIGLIKDPPSTTASLPLAVSLAPPAITAPTPLLSATFFFHLGQPSHRQGTLLMPDTMPPLPLLLGQDVGCFSCAHQQHHSLL